MKNWLQKISDFFVDLITDALNALFKLLIDFGLWILDGFLEAVAFLLGLIPAPCCIPVNGLENLINQLPPYALYVISRADISGAFNIIACGVAFYLLRKLFTLGQW